MQMPAEAVDVAGAFGDQVLFVIDKESEFARVVVEVRCGQVRLAKRRTGDASASIGSDFP